MSAIAQEMSRRMTPEYAKERASEMAREKAYELRERATDSSWFLPLIGAGIGALLGKTLASRAQHGRDDWRYESRHLGAGYGYERGRYGATGHAADDRYGYGYGSEVSHGYGSEGRYAYVGGEGISDSEYGSEGESTTSRIGDQASQLKERVADQASEMKERVTGKAGEYQERIRERASALRERLPDPETVRSSAREDEGLWALGAMALGAAFGLAIPMSQREREVLEPARRKVREAGQQAKEAALEKGTQAIDQASSRLDEATEHQEEGSRTGSSLIVPPSPSTPPLH